MICKSYENLNVLQQREMIGKIVTAMQMDDKIFKYVDFIIKLAERQGTLDAVTICPDGISTALSDLDNPIENGIY